MQSLSIQQETSQKIVSPNKTEEQQNAINPASEINLVSIIVV